MDTSNLNADEVSNVIDKLNNGIRELLPELKDVKLNIEQIIAVIEMMVDYATPDDQKELEKRGISMTTDQKKTASAWLKWSQYSCDSITVIH